MVESMLGRQVLYRLQGSRAIIKGTIVGEKLSGRHGVEYQIQWEEDNSGSTIGWLAASTVTVLPAPPPGPPLFGPKA